MAGDSSVDISLLRRMLLRERQLRLSPAIQAAFEAAERRPDVSWMQVTEQLQHQVVREFGWDDVAFGLHVLRTAGLDHLELAEIPIQVRFNRTRRGKLCQGDAAPEALIVPISDRGEALVPMSLLTLARPGIPLVLLAGSYS